MYCTRMRMKTKRIKPKTLWVSFLNNACFLSFVVLTISICECSKLDGHLQKLGSHRDPLGIAWAGKFSSPAVFYQYFVALSKPVIMKRALEHSNHPGLFNWTDGFLSKKFGSEMVKVEQSKIENRGSTALWVPFKDFLNTYQTEDIYLVHSLNKKMRDLVLIPRTLQCGGFQKAIQEAVLWMGSHAASSVLHRDPLDNLLCVMNGRKYVVLIDKAYKDKIEATGFDSVRGFSTVDPQRVDFDKFPQLAHVNWHEASLEKGDCLFIPQGWYHQVASSGYRHLSVNLWFSHLWWFNKTDCPLDINDYKHLEPISKFGFASPNEAHRSELLSRFKHAGILSRWVFRDFLPTNPTQERADELFDAINLFPDGAVTWNELYAFDIDKILLKFWDLFDLPEKIDNPIKEELGKDDEEKIEFDENFSEISKGSGSPKIDLEGSYQENEAKYGSENDGEGKVSDDKRLPLPDAVSSDTPSLPDDTVNNVIHTINAYEGEHILNENADEFCSNEENCGEEMPSAFHQFTEFDSDDQSQLSSDNSDSASIELENGPKPKDEL